MRSWSLKKGPAGALTRWEYASSIWKAKRAGGVFIAQQAEKVDDLYTFLGIEQEIDGEKFRVMNVDYTAIIADLVTVVQDLIRRVDALESWGA